MERRVLRVLKAFADYRDLMLGGLLEGIVLHTFEGRPPFNEDCLRRTEEFRKFYDLALDSGSSHRLSEAGAGGPRKERDEGEDPEMKPRLKMFAIPALRWVLALVLLLESAHFAISPAAARQFAGTGLPRWIPPALGGSEVIAALLFLVPAASLVGGYALLFIFAIAVGVHFLLGQYDVGHLLVYGMAVIVCITGRKNPTNSGAA